MKSSPLGIDLRDNPCKLMRTVKIENGNFYDEVILMIRENFRCSSVVDFRTNKVTKIVENSHKNCTKIGTLATKILVIF
jgi:hypothetical protein